MESHENIISPTALSQAVFLYYLFLSLASKKVELLMKKFDYPIILDNDAFKNKFICFSAEIKVIEQKVNLIFLYFAISPIFNIPQTIFLL